MFPHLHSNLTFSAAITRFFTVGGVLLAIQLLSLPVGLACGKIRFSSVPPLFERGCYPALLNPSQTARAADARSSHALKDHLPSFRRPVRTLQGSFQGQREITLRPQSGSVIEGQLKRDIHIYLVDLTREQYVEIAVAQLEIDLAIAIWAPNGRKLAEVNESIGKRGAESFSLVADLSGVYRIEVSSANSESATGRYSVKVAALRTATTDDRSRASAGTAFREADLLLKNGSLESLRSSIKRYEEALQRWQAAKDQPNEVKALSRIASVHSRLDNYRIAHEFYTRTLSLSRTLQDRFYEAVALNGLGIVSWGRGDHKQALEYYRQSLEPRKASH